MCQLLGMNANTPTDVMFSFTGLATRADDARLCLFRGFKALNQLQSKFICASMKRSTKSSDSSANR